jgi:hypothetical protein
MKAPGMMQRSSHQRQRKGISGTTMRGCIPGVATFRLWSSRKPSANSLARPRQQHETDDPVSTKVEAVQKSRGWLCITTPRSPWWTNAAQSRSFRAHSASYWCARCVRVRRGTATTPAERPQHRATGLNFRWPSDYLATNVILALAVEKRHGRCQASAGVSWRW